MDNFEYLKITERQQKIIKDYLDSLKNYVKKHHIEMEVYNDIEEMLYEKLSKAKCIDDLTIKKSIKEVGEPKDIFSDLSEDTEDVGKKEIFYKKLAKKGWVRDNSGAIFLGISKTFAEKLGVPIRVIRLILLLLIIVGGLSIWAYILAGIILPVKGKNYDEKGFSGYFFTQIVCSIKDCFFNFVNFTIMLIPSFFNKIGKIMRFIFFLILSFCFAGVLIGLIFIGAFYFSDFSIYDIDFFFVLPIYFIRGIIFGIIATAILGVASFLYGIGKKSLNGYFILFGGASLIIALFLGISSGFDLAKTYIGESEITQKASFEILDTSSGVINLDISKVAENYGIEEYFYYSKTNIKVKVATGSLLSIKVNKKIIGSENLTDRIINNFNEINLEKEDDTIILNYENNKAFKSKVPLTMIDNDVTIYLPKNYQYNLGYNKYKHRYYYENIFVNNDFEQYKDYINQDCRYKTIYYSEVEDNFVCDLSDSEIKSAKFLMLKTNLINKFESFSTIKHVDKYKNTYRGDYNMKSDWSFDNIYNLDDDTVIIEFGDRSLDINAQVDYKENEDGILEFSNFKINDVDANYAYQEKYYQDISAIRDFINEEE